MKTTVNHEEDYFKKILYGLLEKIIFNENDFDLLKKSIKQLSIGKIEPKKLKQTIIQSRIKILDELLDIFPFYIEQMNKKQSMNEYIEDNKNSDLIQEIKEKNELLSGIALKVHTIFTKIKEKGKG